MSVFRRVALTLSICTILLITQYSYAQTTFQPLIPAQLGGVASVSSIVQVDPQTSDVVTSIREVKVQSIGSVNYAIAATTTGIIFVPQDTFSRESSIIFVPHNTMQGDLADFLIRNDLATPELHILSTQVKGETLLRYNLTALLQGSSDRAAFLGEPRFFQNDLLGDLSIFYNNEDGYTYICDVDAQIVRFMSRDPSENGAEEVFTHGCRGSGAVQYNPKRNIFYFACPDAKVTIISVNSANFNASTEDTQELSDPSLTVSLHLDTQNSKIVAVLQQPNSSAFVHFVDISNAGWQLLNETVELPTNGAAISTSALDVMGLLYVARSAEDTTDTKAAIYQVDVANARLEALTEMDISVASDISAISFDSISHNLFFASLTSEAKLSFQRWTGATPCELDCSGNGVCVPQRKCQCNSAEFLQPWCTAKTFEPVSAPTPTESSPIPSPSASPVAAPDAVVEPPVAHYDAPHELPLPPHVVSPLGNNTLAPSGTTNQGTNKGLIALGVMIGLIVVAIAIAVVVNFFVQKKEKRRGARLRETEATASSSQERNRLLDDM